jgi:hypothetical protein
MDFFEVLENIKEDADRTLKGSRYDDQIAIFGNEIQKKKSKKVKSLWSEQAPQDVNF